MKLIRKIQSIVPTYQKHGIDGLVYAILKNLKLNTKFVSIIDKKKYYLEKKIIQITNKTVLSGIYKSTKLTCKSHWGGFDTSSKLLGLYEKQVQEKIVELKNKFHLEYFINFGAGDGYHALGLLKNNIFKYAYVFEINDEGRIIINENLKINNLNEKIKVMGKADFDELQKDFDNEKLKKSLFLIDIEGEEFKILNEMNLPMLKNSIFIIENHDFLSNKQDVEKFFNLMKKYFHLEILKNGSRNPNEISEIKHFDDDEKWLLVSENRKQTMNWLIFLPKN
tara:strand:- start:476 stop:1315 length:840 start_codon:yes stop_codon:yes gene_type:complete